VGYAQRLGAAAVLFGGDTAQAEPHRRCVYKLRYIRGTGPALTQWFRGDATILADDAALELAREWVQCTYCGWLATGAEDGGNLFEKYDVTKLGVPGEGGEYDVQEGTSMRNRARRL